MNRWPSTSCAAALWLLAAACTGVVHEPGGGGDDDDGPGGTQSEPAEAARFPRLTHAQWENTVTDLFYLETRPALGDDFQPDPPLGRFDNNVARLSVTSGLWQDYQRAGEIVAERVTSDPALLDRIAPADGQARTFVESFGARAFRRPLDDAEIDRYVAIFEAGATNYPELESFTAGMRMVVQTMLQSPYFLYRVELSDEVVNGAVPLSGYEVASRLSYAFWNTMPDDALFGAAADGELDTADGVRAWADQMFDDPRTAAQFERFHFQAYEMLSYADLDKDTSLFPQWRREVGVLMQTEAQLFFDSIVFGDGTIGDLFTSRTAFVNDELAPIYGMEGSFGPEFVQVELDDTQRAGVLTRVGFLAKNATLTEPDPIHRGVFVNLNLLCRQISAVPNLPDDLMPVGDTNRERIDSITGEGTCGASCHAGIINPIGFALENYDALGGWRTQDNGFPVDAAATYVFEDGRSISFQNGLELSQQLAQAPEVHACYVRHLVEYLYGRDVNEGDAAVIESLAQQSLEGGLTIREIVVRLVSLRAFRYRPVDTGVSP